MLVVTHVVAGSAQLGTKAKQRRLDAAVVAAAVVGLVLVFVHTN